MTAAALRRRTTLTVRIQKLSFLDYLSYYLMGVVCKIIHWKEGFCESREARTMNVSPE